MGGVEAGEEGVGFAPDGTVEDQDVTDGLGGDGGEGGEITVLDALQGLTALLTEDLVVFTICFLFGSSDFEFLDQGQQHREGLGEAGVRLAVLFENGAIRDVVGGHEEDGHGQGFLIVGGFYGMAFVGILLA